MAHLDHTQNPEHHMRFRDHIALTLPSFLLRLVLAITFLWAGTSKIIGTTTTQGDNAARLANMGVTFLAPQIEQAVEPEAPINPLPESSETPLELVPAHPTYQSDTLPDPESQTETEDQSAQAIVPPVIIQPVVQTTAPAVGSDYPDPVYIKRVHKIALLIDHSVSPGLTPDSQPITPILPSWMGSGKMPIISAWATAITELAAGVFLLIGFLTRFSAFSLSIVMLVAIWTTNLGPAVLQSNDAILGFIPNKPDLWDPSAYSVLLWQVSVLVMCISVCLLGAGPLSIDRLLFRPGRRDPYVSGESARPQPAPKQKETPVPAAERSSFDRTPPPPSNPTP